MSKMKPSGRPIEEVQKQATEEFFRHNGYYPTVEQIVQMVDEARAEIRAEREAEMRREKEQNNKGE